jgi:thymidine kinase
MKAIKTATLEAIYPAARNYDVVAIDEGQFFPDIVDVSERLANEGVVVVIAALDGTFQRKPFGHILSLVPMAEQVIKLSAVCIECGREAAFTRRTVDSQEVELIGGEESYKPVCRNCFDPALKAQRAQSILAEKSANSRLTNPEITVTVKNS